MIGQKEIIVLGKDKRGDKMRGSYIRYLRAYSIIHGGIGSNILLFDFLSVYIFMLSVALKVTRQKQRKTTKNENNKNN